MVGLVLVSHSHEIAEGVAALARQMGGEDLSIATAGGLDGTGDEHPIGTDAARIVAAIEHVWSEDGVLVLMDLGSAVLSAEMALEFLDPDRREKVRLSGAPFVEGAISAAVAAKLGRPLDGVADEALGGLAGKTAHLEDDHDRAGRDGTATATATDEQVGPEVRLPIVIDLPHGLHARPAARLVQTAGAFDADVRVENVTAGRGPVSARSLNAVATLGVTVGQRIEVVARGPQATLAIDAVRALADRRFDEDPEDLIIAEPATDPGVGRGPGEEGTIVGIPASPGIAVGPVRHLHVPELPLADGPAGTPEEEGARLDAAIAAVRGDIARQRDAAARRVGMGEAAIFDAHLLFLRGRGAARSRRGPASRIVVRRQHGPTPSRGWRPPGRSWTTPTSGSEPTTSEASGDRSSPNCWVSKRRTAGSGRRGSWWCATSSPPTRSRSTLRPVGASPLRTAGRPRMPRCSPAPSGSRPWSGSASRSPGSTRGSRSGSTAGPAWSTSTRHRRRSPCWRRSVPSSRRSNGPHERGPARPP